ncbi:hypothetical protein STRCI_004045 [Streptomyces cinnabarinus]|uniref:Lipoprotein n=1 Tax=Streptomyces cinnabarinus TaxID=67287 RepID=A0ABY7KDX9_9ACTN|nr:hypothetical protein [Streptomyces cinnabarinus]WAZ22754.1 hypothetical protein STRCI_004045 [Streptomyces cinnabarinus]
MSAFLLASCTSSDDAENTSAPRPTSPAPSPTGTTSGPPEKDLTERAQAAIAAVHSGTLVEAGVERVSDGIHTEPGLSKGRTYQLNLVCAGNGSARLQFVPAQAGAETSVPCDESVVQQRITGDELVRINVAGAKGSTGVIAWQIDAL